jgi:hypothetical protein
MKVYSKIIPFGAGAIPYDRIHTQKNSTAKIVKKFFLDVP